MLDYEIQKLASFEIKSGEAMISDPCYPIGTWCQGVVHNVKNGTWQASVCRVTEIIPIDKEEYKDIRNAILFAHHKDHEVNMLDDKWITLDIDIGVDGGSAGIYDYASYGKDESVPAKSDVVSENSSFKLENLGDKWGNYNADLTLDTEFLAGVLPTGVVSSSGYGDGSYEVSVVKAENSKVVGIKIIFIDIYESEEEEDFYGLNELFEGY